MTCIKCGKDNTEVRFCKRADANTYYRTCNSCKAKVAKKRSREQIRDSQYRNLYGITLEQYLLMAKNQEHKCLLCGTLQSELRRDLFVDHCHATGRIRGLLCHACNVGLGLFKDNKELLSKAIAYLDL